MNNVPDKAIDANTVIVRNAVEALGLIYVAKPVEADQDRLTSIHFEAGQSGPGWTTSLFSTEEAPTVRLISWLELDASQWDRLRVLETVNFLNYSYLLDTVIDYSPDHNHLRLRDIFRASAGALDQDEFAEALRTHLSHVYFWNFVLDQVIKGTGPVDETISKAVQDARVLFDDEVDNTNSPEGEKQQDKL